MDPVGVCAFRYHQRSKSQVWADSSRRGLFGVRYGLMPSNPVIRAFPRMYFSSACWVMPLFTIFGCFEKGRSMSPYARSHPVAVFVSQASAMDQCDQRRVTYLSSLAPAILGSPRNIRRCDTEAASPRRTRCNTPILPVTDG